MDPTATFVIALIGAVSGVGSLLWQFLNWKRAGAVIRVEGRIHRQREGNETVDIVKVLVRNKGRHPAQIRWVALSEHRLPRRLGRPSRLRRFVFRLVRRARGHRATIIKVAHPGPRESARFPGEVQGLATREYVIEEAPWMAEAERAHPYAELGHGRRKRGRSLKLK